MKKIIIAVLALAVISITLISTILLMPTESSSKIPFLKGFSNANIEKKQVYGLDAKEISASTSNQIIKVLHLGKSDLKTARLFLDEKKFGIESLYNPLPSPYPDVITREIVCPHEYLPDVGVDNNENFYKIIYELFANERLSYGACSPDSIAHKAVFSLIHCKKSNDLYQIKFFSTLESSNQEILNEIRNFNC